MLALGLLVNLVGATGLAVTVLSGLGLPFLLGSLFVMVSALGLVFPTSTALALADYPDRAGAASSLLGLGQYVLGAVVAPLVGLAGQGTAVPLGLVAVSCSGAASSSSSRSPCPRCAAADSSNPPSSTPRRAPPEARVRRCGRRASEAG